MAIAVSMDSARRPRLIVIEGVIGSGKTTCLNFLKTAFKERTDIEFVDEPVELYQSFCGFKPLDLLEVDPFKNAVAVQIHIIHVLYEFYKNKLCNLSKDIKLIVCDRYLTSAVVFIDTLFVCNYITSFDKAVLAKVVSSLAQDLLTVDAVLYLDRSVTLCRDRICQRARSGEVTFATNLTYLRSLDRSYNRVLKDKSSLWYSTDCIALTELSLVFEKLCTELPPL